jgi:acyl carrier protein
MENFEEGIAELLEVDNVNMNDELDSFECWDSLTLLSIIAFTSENYDVTLSNTDVIDSKTVGGLKELIRGKM